MSNKKFDYNEIKKKFFVGVICFVLGVIFAVGGHLHAQKLDILNLLYYEVTDIRVYAFVICTLLGVILIGIPFVRVTMVRILYALIFYMISHSSKIMDEIKVSGADVFYFSNKDGSTNYKREWGRFELTVTCILGIILLFTAGLMLYIVGCALSILVLIIEMIYLIVKQKSI